MDGQARLFSNRVNVRWVAGVLLIAGVVCLPRAGFGQAMGKAVIDVSDTPAVEASPAPPRVPVNSTKATVPSSQAPAVLPAPTPPAPAVESKTPAVVALAAPATLPATSPPLTATPATPSAVPATSAPASKVASPAPLPLADAPPAATTRSAISKIEQEPIRPHPASQAVASVPPTTRDAATATGTTSGLPSMPSGVTSTLQVLAALAVVVGLIYIAKAAARKYIPGAKSAAGKGVVEVLARHPLCKTQALVLVRIGSQIVALNQGKDSSESVLVISEPEEVARIIGQIEGRSPKSIQAGFTKLLANARMDLEKGDEPPEEEDLRKMGADSLDEQLEEMAAAKRQLMELRQHVRTVRDRLPRA